MTIKRNGDAKGAPEINRLAAVLQAPAGQLARVFGAYAKKGETA